MKKCSNCKRDKKKLEFNKNSGKKDGLHNVCKPCNKEYQKRHYKKNKAVYRANNTNRRMTISDWLWKIKSSPCKDCKNSFHPCIMDFDHLPEFAKTKAISEMVHEGYSKDTIQNEISKCELVCANCHRLRTHERMLHSSTG